MIEEFIAAVLREVTQGRDVLINTLFAIIVLYFVIRSFRTDRTMDAHHSSYKNLFDDLQSTHRDIREEQQRILKTLRDIQDDQLEIREAIIKMCGGRRLSVLSTSSDGDESQRNRDPIDGLDSGD